MRDHLDATGSDVRNGLVELGSLLGGERLAHGSAAHCFGDGVERSGCGCGCGGHAPR